MYQSPPQLAKTFRLKGDHFTAKTGPCSDNGNNQKQPTKVQQLMKVTTKETMRIADFHRSIIQS
jgi:hypothetical protein